MILFFNQYFYNHFHDMTTEVRGGAGRGQGRKPSSEAKYYRVKIRPAVAEYLEKTYGDLEGAIRQLTPLRLIGNPEPADDIQDDVPAAEPKKRGRPKKEVAPVTPADPPPVFSQPVPVASSVPAEPVKADHCERQQKTFCTGEELKLVQLVTQRNRYDGRILTMCKGCRLANNGGFKLVH